ncbi:PQQ-dependent sugar dehydrogenase [Roseisolibacter sp. H3M3-2]|uniref:PQQ-dependent sugar dehydrogenase n=1 Tax=Roseisolibacter sp. H3M3-2 TaxID=3031323 RepID=UPI0023DCE070|nr:PQQ-dependent sugar dehydrogenase [Roseisolibacter sp. H3M3-2]MDF1504856.1 PQQ-dependent sugar dehydrogenase [Roseisolibacter sp. H3M3-2]
MRILLRSALAAALLAGACTDAPDSRVPTAPRLDRDGGRAGADAGTANNVGPSPLLAPIPVGVELVASGLASPIQLVQPDKVTTRFVVDQIGLVRMIAEDGTLLAEPFLDVRSRLTPLNPASDERGLLGLAFHPEFRKNGRVFVFYTAPPRVAGYNNTITIAEYRADVSAGSNANKIMTDEVPRVIPGSERIVLQVDHPQANHNGGTVAFGPDGYLYVSIGDGGGRDDDNPLGHVADWFADNAGGNGQDITQNLLGNILRIDVDGGTPYAIPPDNPFVAGPGLDEIWAYGFRNPYRFAFDSKHGGALLVGDAGQELWEEVSVAVRGGNFGWNVKEGTHCFDAEAPTVVPATCPTVDPTTGEPLRNPVIEFANSKNPLGGDLGLTVVGGVFYHGEELRALRGRYVFGSAATQGGGSGRLFVSEPRGSGLWSMAELLVDGTSRLGHVVKGFGEDARGNVYVTGSVVFGPTGTTGKVWRLTRPR